MTSPFTYPATVRLHNVDAAGRLFFADQFVLAHDAWEACLEAHGLGIGTVLATGDFLMPIVHAEADYTAPLGIGDNIQVMVRCQRMGTTSFTLQFDLAKAEGEPVGRVQHIHATIAKATGRPIPLPGTLREVLQRITPAAA